MRVTLPLDQLDLFFVGSKRDKKAAGERIAFLEEVVGIVPAVETNAKSRVRNLEDLRTRIRRLAEAFDTDLPATAKTGALIVDYLIRQIFKETVGNSLVIRVGILEEQFFGGPQPLVLCAEQILLQLAGGV